eukprot:COSAG03_NODE_15262_length_436_cov_0.931751_1_plen_38_part_10
MSECERHIERQGESARGRERDTARGGGRGAGRETVAKR